MSKSHRTAARILFFLYLAAVLVLCFAQFKSTPDVPTSFLGIPTDKVVHFCMFFPFPILAFLAFDKYTESIPATIAFAGISFVVGFLLACGTEWGQATLTNYRSGDRYDLLSDTLALTAGTLLVVFWDIFKQRRGKKRQKPESR